MTVFGFSVTIPSPPQRCFLNAFFILTITSVNQSNCSCHFDWSESFAGRSMIILLALRSGSSHQVSGMSAALSMLSLFAKNDSYPQWTRGHTVLHHRFAILPRYCRSAYVQYASFQCLAESQICGAKLLRTPSAVFWWLARQRNEAYWTYAD